MTSRRPGSLENGGYSGCSRACILTGAPVRRTHGLRRSGERLGLHVSMNAMSNRLFSGALCSACLLAALTHLGCRGEPAPGPAVATSSTAAIAQASSVAVVAPPPSASAPQPSAAPSATAPPVTVAALRAEAAADPARFKSTRVALDGYFSSRSLRRFGSEGHPYYDFVLILVALGRGDSDTLTCEMSGETWPPVGLVPGDPIAVSGVWSMDRMLTGGRAEDGGPLQIQGCKVARRSTEAPSH